MIRKQKKDSLEIFASAPVNEAVLTNAIPAMIAMLMVLIYNMADMFFVGQTHSALMLAAVSLATPVFLIFMGVGNIFGIGGTSVISRALGEGRTEYARKVSSFCMWGSVFTGVLLSAVLLACMNKVLSWIGASPDTWEYTREYLSIVAYAGPFVMISTCYSNIIRTEGKPGIAMSGQVLGNLLNIVLDPIMILVMKMGVAGAAWATAISNIVSALYYVFFLAGKRSMLGIHLKNFAVSDGIFQGVMAIGIPASLGNLLMSASHIIANALIASYHDDMAVAGFGVAMKVIMITGILCIGFAQGVQPLLGYCIGAKNISRFKECLRVSVFFAGSIGTVLMVLCFVFAEPLAALFLKDPGALAYAIRFSRILLSTSFLFGLFYVLTNALQAMGEAGSAMIINLSRQGFIYIPALFILNSVLGMNGLVFAQPIADVLSTVLVIFLYRRAIRRLEEKTALDSHQRSQAVQS